MTMMARYLCHQEHQPENVAFFEENGIRVYQCPIDGNKVSSFRLAAKCNCDR